MVQKSTYLIPIDKCGVWYTKIFHLYGGFKRQYSCIGNFIKVSVKLTKPNNWVKKKTKLKSILIRSVKETTKLDGCTLRFKYNNNILLKKRLTPKGKELTGPGVFKVKRKKFLTSFIKVI